MMVGNSGDGEEKNGPGHKDHPGTAVLDTACQMTERRGAGEDEGASKA